MSVSGVPITVHGSNMMMLTSQHRLQPFADESLVAASTNHQLPDMFPVSPLIDLQQNLGQPWEKTNSLGKSATINMSA